MMSWEKNFFFHLLWDIHNIKIEKKKFQLFNFHKLQESGWGFKTDPFWSEKKAISIWLDANVGFFLKEKSFFPTEMRFQFHPLESFFSSETVNQSIKP